MSKGDNSDIEDFLDRLFADESDDEWPNPAHLPPLPAHTDEDGKMIGLLQRAPDIANLETLLANQRYPLDSAVNSLERLSHDTATPGNIRRQAESAAVALKERHPEIAAGPARGEDTGMSHKKIIFPFRSDLN